MPDDIKIATLRTATPAEEPPPKGQSEIPLRTRVGIPAFAVSIAIICVGIVTIDWNRWTSGAASQSTDDAFVTADVSTLSAQVAGTVRALKFSDYQSVAKGDLLAEIDDREYLASVKIAEASLASAEAALANLANQIDLQKAAILAAQAQRESANAQLAQAEQEFKRQASLGGATTQQMLQQAQSAFLQAQAAERIADAAIEQQKAQLNVLSGQEPLLTAQVRSAQGTLCTSRIRLGYTRILSPFDGVVGRRLVHEGDLVATGSGIVSLVPLPQVYVTANFKETQLANMRPDGRAEISVDSFPGVRLSGRVSRLAPASGSVFALLPPDNATGNYTKVVQRVPVRIEVDAGQAITERLRPGMSATVSVETPLGTE
ncbi:HlyD family secretion protein [Rhizobium sp. S163]|uniref:HlyD family secretion protein n=1 Tax=Rhizobium sp. S163 TaxID=3055039 RepID=UPI0025A94274|nr:HlyD family secretion protein [Rhizobium sp. S163]MDM9648709.1 HlyD family secretion protein [Rhizobium sp. S163]